MRGGVVQETLKELRGLNGVWPLKIENGDTSLDLECPPTSEIFMDFPRHFGFLVLHLLLQCLNEATTYFAIYLFCEYILCYVHN